LVSAATIWLITSNHTLQNSVEQALSSEEYRLRLMAEPKEAIAFSSSPLPDMLSGVMPDALADILPNTVPDLVLLDTQIEDPQTHLNGLTVCAHLRRQAGWQQVPMVVILGSADFAAKEEAFRVGAVDCLVQPLHPAEIKARVQGWCALRGLESQAETQQQRIQQVDQSLRLMLQALSHDLRNPVLGMQMVFRNLLTCTCTHPATVDTDVIGLPRNFVERMVEGSDRHLRLIDALMDVHADMTRPLSLNYELVEPSQLIPALMRDMMPQVQKNRATLHYDIPPDLPLLEVDPLQLGRVFRHLIENAINHNPPGVHLDVTAMATDEAIWFTVQDNGVGIAPDTNDHLFRLCQRGSEARHTHGLGLGLYLCQRIIETHGGKICATNCPEGGARFRFMLPKQAAKVWAASSYNSTQPASLG
jgi:two-component system sensor histidine kinase/response regulator